MNNIRVGNEASSKSCRRRNKKVDADLFRQPLVNGEGQMEKNIDSLCQELGIDYAAEDDFGDHHRFASFNPDGNPRGVLGRGL